MKVAFVAATQATLNAFVKPMLPYFPDEWTVFMFAGDSTVSNQTDVLSFGDVRRRGPIKVLQGAWRLRRLLEQVGADLSVGLTPYGIATNRAAAVGSAWLTASFTHGTMLEAALPVRVFFALFEAATAGRDRVITAVNSKDVKFYSSLPLHRHEVLLAPAGGAGFDTSRWLNGTKAVQPSDPPRLVFVGRRTRSKGLDLLEDVFHRVQRQIPEAELLLIGSATSGEKEWVPKEPVNIELVDWTPYPEAFLSRASVFVSCSPREGYPMSIVEARLAGLPVVAVRNSGSIEVRHALGEDIHLTSTDPAQIADKVIGVCRSPRPEPVPEAVLQKISVQATSSFYVSVIESLRSSARPAR